MVLQHRVRTRTVIRIHQKCAVTPTLVAIHTTPSMHSGSPRAVYVRLLLAISSCMHTTYYHYLFFILAIRP